MAFGPGAAVALANLQSKPELNGTGGTVLAWEESKGRYAVDAGGERLLLKPACLLPAAAVTTTLDAVEYTLRNDAEFPAALLDELRQRGCTARDRYHGGLDAASGWPAHAERSMLLSLEALLLRPGALVGEALAAESVLHASRARLGSLWRRFCEPANELVPASRASSPSSASSSAAFEAWAAQHLPEALAKVTVSPIAGSGLGLLARCALRRREVALAVPIPLLLHATAARQTADDAGALRGLGRALRTLQRRAALHDDVLTLVALVLARRSPGPDTAWGAYVALVGGFGTAPLGFGTALEWDEAGLPLCI